MLGVGSTSAQVVNFTTNWIPENIEITTVTVMILSLNIIWKQGNWTAPLIFC